MGLTVTADKVKVYRNDSRNFPTYSIGVSSKNKDGEWVRGFIECKFKKGVELPNKTEIKINNAFYVVEEYKEKKYVKLMITDFNTTDDSFMEVPDGDTPFFV